MPRDVGARQHVLDASAQPGPARDRQPPSAISGTAVVELVAPGHVVDVDLEDARVRDRRAPLRRDERREVAVVVVRRAVDLERLGEVGDLLRLVEAVPDHVDRGDVHRARLEERPEAAARVEVLARADRASARRGGRCASARRVEEVDLEPERGRTARARARRARAPSGLEVEVEVDDRLGAARRCPRRTPRAGGRARPRSRSAAERAAARAEAGHEHLRLVAGDDDVRLERAEARARPPRGRARSTSSYDASFGVPVTSHARARVVPQCDQ